MNGIRRIAARLPPAEEAVWPGVRNDLFLAHASVYHFAAGFSAGLRVLDAACGTGYGSHILATSGAAQVVGIDISARRVAYAARHFKRPNLRYLVADCTALELPGASFDFIVSSNTLEHLADPTKFLNAAANLLVPKGHLLVAVPPVLSAADIVVHANNGYHASPLSVHGWAELFMSSGWTFRFFSHRCTAVLDFSSPAPSAASASDFVFIPEPVGGAYAQAPLSAVYLLWRAAQPGTEPDESRASSVPAG